MTTPKDKPGPFVRLPKSVIDSAGFAALSPRAVHVLIWLLRQFNGYNNGAISFGCRKAAQLCRCSYPTASRALAELVSANFISAVDKGRVVLGADIKRATTWRVTFLENQNGPS